jgi:hypothetical protein
MDTLSNLNKYIDNEVILNNTLFTLLYKEYLTLYVINNTNSIIFRDQNLIVLEHIRKDIQHLIDNGCNVNILDDEKKTPLHYAKSEFSVKILYEAGADPYIKDIYGNNSLVDNKILCKLINHF